MKLVFNNVDKNFGVISALRNVSFTINPGEFVFIVGPSGAGKSTLLKLILNQIKPSNGEILIDDINLSLGTKSEIDMVRRKIGVIFQDYQLIMDKTIEENVALSLDIVSFPKEKISAKIDEVITQVNLNNRRFLFPSQLSGGELQRASLARALAIEPKIILADEPTGNLDTENTWNLVKLLKDINEKKLTTIIMTTHNQEVVNSLDKRQIEIRDGEIKKDYKPADKNIKKNTHQKKHDQ